MVPVKQHAAQAGHQAVGDIARTWKVVVVFLRQRAAQGGDTGAHHVHGMAGGGQLFQRSLYAAGQAAQSLELGFVGLEFGLCGQLAMYQQMGDLFKLADLGNVQDVVAAVVQVVAGLSHGAQRRIACGHTGEGDGLFGLETCGGVGSGGWGCCVGHSAHGCLLWICSAGSCWSAILRNLRICFSYVQT